jgi:hypothetical protein
MYWYDPAASTPRLLTLPTELRLMILEEVFKDSPYFIGDKLMIDGSQAPPAVLRCCRQLRNEGMATYLHIWKRFTVEDLNAEEMAVYCSWAIAMQEYYGLRRKLRVYAIMLEFRSNTTNETLRANAMKWLRAFYHDMSPGLLRDEDRALHKPGVVSFIMKGDVPFNHTEAEM